MEDIKTFIDEVGEPCFGNENLLLPIIHLIGKQEGIGKLLENYWRKDHIVSATITGILNCP